MRFNLLLRKCGMICWIEFPEWSGIQSSTTNQNKFRIAWLRLNYRLNSFWSQLQLDWNHSLRAKPHSDFKIKPDFRNEWPVIKLLFRQIKPINQPAVKSNSITELNVFNSLISFVWLNCSWFGLIYLANYCYNNIHSVISVWFNQT